MCPIISEPITEWGCRQRYQGAHIELLTRSPSYTLRRLTDLWQRSIFPIIELTILIFLLFLIALLLGLKLRRTEGSGRSRKRSSDGAISEGGIKKTCPLCGSPLSAGERVRSVIYPGKGDTLAEIHGCPHCDAAVSTAGIADNEIGMRNRYCPVCKGVVPENGYVIARYFRRTEKNHMHVLGCTRCRRAN